MLLKLACKRYDQITLVMTWYGTEFVRLGVDPHSVKVTYTNHILLVHKTTVLHLISTVNLKAKQELCIYGNRCLLKGI